MSKSGLFFDLDGTLCDTHDANYEAYRQAFREISYNFKRKDFDDINGMRFDLFAPILAKGISQDGLKYVAKRKAELYPSFMHLVKPNKSLIHFLKLYYKTASTVLVSTARKTNAINVINLMGVEKYFDFFVFGDEVVNPKPDPEPYLLALTKSQLKPSQVIAFEDSKYGIQSARAACIRVIEVKL